MPKTEIDYSKTVMYKIVCNDLNIKDCYIGSTTEFTTRKSSHKCRCTNAHNKKHHYHVYQFIRDNGGWENWSMILIENYPCANNLEARSRERYWCEHFNANLNARLPQRDPKEYRVDNKQNKAEYDKLYREQKAEKIKAYKKAILTCECGCHVQRDYMKRHLLTKKHTDWQIGNDF